MGQPRATPPRRTQEERSATTRGALLDATIACLIELGYAGTTTHKVAARAGVSRGAMLHHYPSKAQLLADAVAQVGERRSIEMEQRAAAFPPRGRDRAAAALDLLWESCQTPLFGASIDLWAAARTDPELREALRPVERAYGERLVSVSRTLFGPEIAQQPGFERLVAIAAAQLRGLAVMLPLERTGRAHQPTWEATRTGFVELFTRAVRTG